MKKEIFAFALALVLALTGCAPGETRASEIVVSLGKTEGLQSIQDSVRIPSGGDAELEFRLEAGYQFEGVDYSGEYALDIRGDRVSLCLYAVRYPTLVQVRLTRNYCAISYDPNGGTGEGYRVVYDQSVHRRPNTETGRTSFARAGYTLTGWNTAPDGSGLGVGLGSRITVEQGQELLLYAQWRQWTPASDFKWETDGDTVRITAYLGSDSEVVIPQSLEGGTVTVIAAGAFRDASVEKVILPNTLARVEDGAFSGSKLRELTVFDNIEEIGDGAFSDCADLTTLRVQAVEPPYGYAYRQESCFADKVDMLILAQGKAKAVFYGGCSMWYNLDGALAQEALGEDYQVINMGLNGVISSQAQLEILTQYLEAGDIFFHTPELSSQSQMMLRQGMINHDRKLWSGLENNYDLVSLLDLRDYPGFFDCFQYWLSKKETAASYDDQYTNTLGQTYLDEYGSIPFLREEPGENLVDDVYLDPAYVDDGAMARLDACYQALRARGAAVYVGFACVNLDALPQSQQENVAQMEAVFRRAISAMEGVCLVGKLEDYLYRNEDFFDTNYHLLTQPARENTRRWMEALTEQLRRDGRLHITLS